MSKKKLVSIIILNWNGIHFTKECIESLWKNTVHKPIEVIVVDNGSNPENVRELKALKKRTLIQRLILNGKNRGFSGGNNQGFAAANGPYLLMLNNDTLVTKGWLKRPLELIEDNSVGAVGCRLIDLEPYKKKGYSLKPDRVVKTTCGAALLTRRDVLNKIGVLDEKHFSPIYGEETDWCYRARHAGYKIMETDKSIVIHLGSQDTKKGRGKASAYELLNTHRIKAMAFNLSIPEFLGHAPGLGLILVNSFGQGMFPSLMKSYWKNAKNWREISRERKKRKARLL